MSDYACLHAIKHKGGEPHVLHRLTWCQVIARELTSEWNAWRCVESVIKTLHLYAALSDHLILNRIPGFLEMFETRVFLIPAYFLRAHCATPWRSDCPLSQ